MKTPLSVDWQQGKLPNVEDVPWDCRIVLWSESYIGLVFPWGNDLNPVRWSDDSYHPRWGITSPEGWWAWLEKGSQSRPLYVRTWNEKYELQTG